MLPLEQIVDLLPVSHAPERIEDYRSAMARGDRFPPIAVVRIGGRYFVADGHKRLSAYKRLNRAPLVVEVWTARRWLRDQWAQFVHKTRQQARLARRLGNPHGRAQARRLALDTLGHWRRMARSVRARLRRAEPDVR